MVQVPPYGIPFIGSTYGETPSTPQKPKLPTPAPQIVATKLHRDKPPHLPLYHARLLLAPITPSDPRGYRNRFADSGPWLPRTIPTIPMILESLPQG